MRWHKAILSVFLITVIAVSGYMILNEQLGRKKESDEFAELAVIASQEDDPTEETTEADPTETVVTESAEKKKGYDELYALNHDFIGWIRIDGTNINYPVMQTKADPEYYLRRNFYKKQSQSGVPFADARCDIGISDNVIIYGHNMKNGTMFSDMRHYKTKSYWREHPAIHFDTLTESGEYEIMSVLITSTEKKKERYNIYNFISPSDESEFNKFIREVKSQSLYDTGITAEYGDRLITLSTCNKSNSSERLIIVARKEMPKLEWLLPLDIQPLLCGGCIRPNLFRR